MNQFTIILIVWMCCLETVWSDNLELLILHNNDVHAHFEEYASSATGKKVGGFGRMLTILKKARKEAEEGTGPPVLYLNAGDTFTGTAWFAVHKWKIAADFMNLLEPDAMCLGNHEFDEGTKVLQEYLASLKFPVVSSNINVSADPFLMNANIEQYVVKTIGEHKVGIVAYLSSQSTVLAQLNKTVRVDPEIPAMKMVTDNLAAMGCKIIIAIGHAGLLMDRQIARNVPLIDIIVGGQSNTFLWNGPQPDMEYPEDNYPVVVDNGKKKILIVHAYRETKYMGYLPVKFDTNGEVVMEGELPNPVFLGPTVIEDPAALAVLSNYRTDVQVFFEAVVGRCLVHLGHSNCRVAECNMGNVVTDAIIEYFLSIYDGIDWTDTAVAIVNSGSIRNGLRSSKNGTAVTKADTMAVLPYEDIISTIELTGVELLDLLESNAEPTKKQSGRFLQMSGLRVFYNPLKMSGKRVVSVKVRCAKCTMPAYSKLIKNKIYKIALPEYLLGGGDAYEILKKKIRAATRTNITVRYMLDRYFTRNGALLTEVGDRIIFNNNTVRSSASHVTLYIFNLLICSLSFFCIAKLPFSCYIYFITM